MYTSRSTPENPSLVFIFDTFKNFEATVKSEVLMTEF